MVFLYALDNLKQIIPDLYLFVLLMFNDLIHTIMAYKENAFLLFTTLLLSYMRYFILLKSFIPPIVFYCNYFRLLVILFSYCFLLLLFFSLITTIFWRVSRFKIFHVANSIHFIFIRISRHFSFNILKIKIKNIFNI